MDELAPSSLMTEKVQEKQDIDSDECSSDENIPLAHLIPLADLIKKDNSTSRPVKRKLVLHSEEGSGTDGEQYSPVYDDIHSSDSEDMRPFVKKCKSMRKQRGASLRDTAWKKKKGKNIRKRKTVNFTSPRNKKLKESIIEKMRIMRKKRTKTAVVERQLIERAKGKSRREEKLRALVQNIHRKRLDNLLQSNELKRIPVPADGNCFFQSVIQSMGLDMDHKDLRNNICDHMLTNAKEYIPFMKYDEATAQESKTEKFSTDVESLKQTGVWNMDVADCFPAALCNIYDQRVRVFSSQVSNSVIDFFPTIRQQSADQYIYLAHTSNKGIEHYDGVCHIMSRQNDHDQLHNQQNEPSDKTRLEENRTPSKSTEAANPPARSSCEAQDTDSSNDIGTPHKRAEYRSPDKKQSSRKKKRDPKSWKRNIRKTQRNKGLKYTNVRGKTVEARSVKARNCSKCRFKCSEKITEEKRHSIFQNYWALENFERQRQFICHHVGTNDPKRHKEGSNRSNSNQFYLTVDNTKVRVCRGFFEATLDIGKKTIYTALAKRKHGVYSGIDGRGRQSPHNKLDAKRIQFVKRHIESFPRMESHYSRKDSKKEYLAHDLNIKKMYDLYVERCAASNEEPVKESKYRQVFCEDYNLSFYRPKKDQCSMCSLYESRKASGMMDSNFKEQYEQHIHRKTEAREEKIKDKDLSKEKESYHVETFDLQAVLTTPCSLVGELYYKRKLCVYNLSSYALNSGRVTCYVWDETQGNRGSCEIATCISKQISSICANPKVEEITFYSDTCAGQNRNQYVATALLNNLDQHKQLKKINHKFFEKGHSQMENDSVHAAIETAKRRTSVFVPSQWHTVISLSRKRNPYVVIPVKYDDILDYKTFCSTVCPNMKILCSGERVNWLNIKWIQVRKDENKSIFFNYSFSPDTFMELKTQRGTREQEKTKDPCPLYKSKLPISQAKKRDLMSMCKSGIIPSDLHFYYSNLPVAANVKDRLPLPDDDDEDDDNDI